MICYLRPAPLLRRTPTWARRRAASARQLVPGEALESTTNDKWRGVYPAICTPFTADDDVDFEAQRRGVRLARPSRSHGIVAFGLAGKVLNLTRPERQQLTDVILDEVHG